MAVKTAARKAEDNAQTTKPVMLVPLLRQKTKFTIYGTSPLIVHKFSKKTLTMLEDKQQLKAKAPKTAKDPDQEALDCLYLNDEGECCFPASSIKLAMVAAATSLGDPRNFGKNKLKQAFFVEGDLLPIQGPKWTRRTDMVRVGPSKSADIRYRPVFEKWSLAFVIEYNASVYSQEQLANLIELAGFAVGLGDWRPEKNGNMGRFTLKPERN